MLILSFLSMVIVVAPFAVTTGFVTRWKPVASGESPRYHMTLVLLNHLAIPTMFLGYGTLLMGPIASFNIVISVAAVAG